MSGSVKDAAGAPIASGKVILRLSQEGTVSDPALLVIQPPVTCTITSGQIDAGCVVRGNDTISPAGTFYRVRIVSATGQELLPERRYVINGATFDLGAATPLASDTVAAQAYQTVQDEGAALIGQRVLNFVGPGVTASNDAANGRTTVTISGGGGGSATHQIDGVALTAQDPINFQDTATIDFTNPSAGNLQATVRPASVTDAMLAANYAGVGTCTNQVVTATNDNAAPTCSTVTSAFTSGTFAPDAHALVGASHTASGLTTGTVVRATGASAFAWQQLAFSDLGGSAARAQLPAAAAYEDEANVFTAAGGLTLDNQLGLRLREADANGDNYLELRSSASRTADYTLDWAVTGDCTANANGGALTINASNQIVCSDDDGGTGGGITSLNAQTGATQTFSDVDDANVTLAITSAANNHQWALGWTGTLAKARQNAATVYTDQGNAYSAGAQDFGAAASLKLPTSAGAAPTASGLIAYDSTSNTLEYGENGTNRTLVNSARGVNTSAPLSGGGDLSADRTLACASCTTDTNAQTLTNKTLNVEATGNVITTVSKVTFVAAGCNNATAGPGWDIPTSNGPTASCYGTSPQRFGGLDFADGASALTSTTHLRLPSDWTGAIDAGFIWFSGSTSTNSVVWTLATACVADGEGLLAPTFNTAQTVSDANNATANTRNSATISTITTTGCAAGETLFLRIGRDPTNGSDTLAATAVLLELELTLRRTQ
ncbi:MAG TPA: hypothetical protein VNN18_06785 [Candidatus Xenobia bacterium]|nr:hypothetical protein [Candidatus Xenobia bacterium]